MGSDHHTVDVETSDHDAVKRGVLVQHRSRVLVSAEAYPNPTVAEEVAAQITVAIHGGMPTRVLLCL